MRTVPSKVIIVSLAEAYEVFDSCVKDLITDAFSENAEEGFRVVERVKAQRADIKEVIDFVDTTNAFILTAVRAKKGVPDRIMVEVKPHSDTDRGEYVCIFDADCNADADEWNALEKVMNRKKK